MTIVIVIDRRRKDLNMGWGVGGARFRLLGGGGGARVGGGKLFAGCKLIRDPAPN